MMDFRPETPSTSLWSKMLEDQLSSKRDRLANVFVFGDPLSGKKRMLDGLKRYTSLEGGDVKRKEEGQEREKVYIMDFKFIHLRQLVEDEVQEIGKINFFIYNRKYNFVGELLTQDMMQNMLLVFVVDLEAPETLEDSLNSWFEYVSTNIAPFLRTFQADQLQELSASYANILKRFAEFGRVNPEAAKKTGKVEEIVEEKEEEHREDEVAAPGQTAPESAPGSGDPLEQIQIPILILGSKADKLEELTNNQLKDYVEFTLQKLAKKLGATLFTISAFKDWNMDLVSQFVLYTLFNKPPEGNPTIPETDDLKKMFLRPSSIDLEETKKQYPGAKSFSFPKKKEAESTAVDTSVSDIKGINDFLQDVKEGKTKYSEEAETSVFVNTSNPAGFYASNLGASAAPDRSGLFAIQTDKIRNLLKQNG